MTSMEMFLPSCYSFRLPVAASVKYEALTELTLYRASFFDDEGESSGDGGGRTLGDFLSSSCCPRLRKLEILFIKGLAQLVIRSEALERFKLGSAKGIRVVDVTAPNLRILELEYCFGEIYGDEDVTVRIASSTLQEIGIRHYSLWRRRPDLNIHDLTSVCRVSSLRLNMHGQYYNRSTDVGFWLLEKCPSVEHVGVSLHHQWSPPSSVIGGDTTADLTSEGAATFSSVRSVDMSVWAHGFLDGQLVPSIFALLLRCPCLRSLRIKIFDDTERLARSGTCPFSDKHYAWTDNRSFSLESLLEDVKITGFGGADEDMNLVRLLFAISMNSIKRVTLDEITKTPGTLSLNRMMAEDDNATETTTMDEKLMSIPTVDRGRWHFGNTIYTWTSYAGDDDANATNSA